MTAEEIESLSGFDLDAAVYRAIPSLCDRWSIVSFFGETGQTWSIKEWPTWEEANRERDAILREESSWVAMEKTHHVVSPSNLSPHNEMDGGALEIAEWVLANTGDASCERRNCATDAGCICEPRGQRWCWWFSWASGWRAYAWANSLPEAICKAALKAVLGVGLEHMPSALDVCRVANRTVATPAARLDGDQ